MTLDEKYVEAEKFIGKLVIFPIEETKLTGTVRAARKVESMQTVLFNFIEYGSLSINYIICKEAPLQIKKE